MKIIVVEKILSVYRAHKLYFIIGGVVILFFLARIVLLKKPNTEITYTVKIEDLVDSIQVSGTYTTASQIEVPSPTNGIISEIYVSNNNVVKKGDALFHVESTATEDQKRTALASLLSAKAVLDADTARLNSLQSTMFSANQAFVTDRGVTEPSDSQKADPKYIEENADWLAAEANYKNQQGVLAKDQAALSAASQAYNETQSVTVVAPSTGTVVNLLSKVGDQVYASLSSAQSSVSAASATGTTSTIPVLIISNFGNPYISSNISENYITRIVPGQKADIVFDALKNQTFEGRIENIATVGTNIEGVVTYSARITAQYLPASVKPNMTALITIETLRKNNVIDVPNSAIVSKNGQTYVLEAKTHRNIRVTLMTKGLAKTEISEGLTAGRTIVANPE